jgi:hypothetical protein
MVNPKNKNFKYYLLGAFVVFLLGYLYGVYVEANIKSENEDRYLVSGNNRTILPDAENVVIKPDNSIIPLLPGVHVLPDGNVAVPDNLMRFYTEHMVTCLNPDPIYLETNVSSLISIKNEDDIDSKRNALIQYIWKEEGFPHSKLPTKTDEQVNSNMLNLKQIDRIDVSMDYGVNSTIYHFQPINSNGKLIIYHQGHRGNFSYGLPTIQYFLVEGYSVMAFSMPLLGMNSQPTIDFPRFGKFKMDSHEQFILLDSENFSSIKFFVEPVAAALNYADDYYNYSSYSMIGISGGGWTTTLYAALDPRISRSYPVAGTLPMYLRSNSSRNWGDYEQHLPELYETANYLELYIMGSYGENRKQLQILNKYDENAFCGVNYQTYDKIVGDEVNRLGKGEFQVYLDDTHDEHIISSTALHVFFSDLS